MISNINYVKKTLGDLKAKKKFGQNFLIDLMVLLLFGTLKGVLKRGHYKEFVKTLNHVFIVGLLAVLYLFTIQKGIMFSRFVLFLAIAIYLVLTYIVREVWKVHIKKGINNGNRRKLLIVSSSDIVNLVIDNIEKNNYSRYDIVGVALLDKNLIGKTIHNTKVVADNDSVAMKYSILISSIATQVITTRHSLPTLIPKLISAKSRRRDSTGKMVAGWRPNLSKSTSL